MWQKCLWKTVLLPFFLLVSAGSYAADVQLGLQQAVDVDCDGVAESSRDVAPGSCLIYQLDVVNYGELPRQAVAISAVIPEHTVLFRSYRLKQAVSLLDPESQINENTDGSRLIQTQINQLLPGSENRVVLDYIVRVL